MVASRLVLLAVVLVAALSATTTATATESAAATPATPATTATTTPTTAVGSGAAADDDDDDYEYVDGDESPEVDAADAEADAEKAADRSNGVAKPGEIKGKSQGLGKAASEAKTAGGGSGGGGPKKPLMQVWYYPYDGVETIIHGCRRLFKTKSAYQSVEVVDSPTFGRILLLDDIVMSAEKDEYIYHETLVHPAMMAHPNPRHVMIAGGGELSTAREVLKHKSVERVTLVDIDGAVVDAARTYLAAWGNTGEYLRDPRLSVVVADAFGWLEAYAGPPLDVVIMDISDPDFGMTTEREPWEAGYGRGGLQPGQYDPYEAPRMGESDVEITGPTHPIYQPKFFQLIKRKLSADGVLVTQSTSATDVSFTWLYRTLCTEFDGRASECANVHAFTAHVPSFSALWTFLMVSKSGIPSEPVKQPRTLPSCGSVGEAACNAATVALPVNDIAEWNPRALDAALRARTAAPSTVTPLHEAQPPYDQLLRWYDGEAHRHMFSLPKPLRQRLRKVITGGFAPINTNQTQNTRVWY